MGITETGIAFMRYGPRWRAHRKLFNDFINPSTVNDYDANQVKVISNFLVHLHQKPEDFKEHINLCVLHFFAIPIHSIYHPSFSLTGSLALSIAYGIRAETPENEFFCMYKGVLEAVNEASVPGTFIVDILPFRGSSRLSMKFTRTLTDNDLP